MIEAGIIERVEFRCPDVTLIGDVTGPADGLPVLFLHGGGQTRGSWGRAANQAAKKGYRAISLDLRGHGESEWAPDRRYDLQRFVEDVTTVIGVLSQPPILVGASLGGSTALLIAASKSPPVSGLVLVDIAIRLETQGTSEVRAFMASAPLGFATPDDAADAVAAYLPHRERPADTSGLMRNLRKRENGRYYWHWDPAFATPVGERPHADQEALESAARRIDIPTLLVRGERSRVLSPEGAREFLSLVPRAEYVEVDRADHMVAGDANDKFNASVFGFLARHFSRFATA
jgi:pimeloyl-ACP methyl ester carboxylesterase